MSRPTRSRSHEDGRDRWEMVEVPPDPRLRGLVDHYGWWRELTTSFDTRRELAGTAETLIVNLGEPLEIVDANGDRHRLRAGDGFIAGIAQATSLSRSTGEMTGVHVRAPIATLARLARLPIAELTNRVVTFADLRGTKHTRVGDMLLHARTSDERWAALDHFVGEQLAATESGDPVLDHLVSRLAAGIRVQALADDIGWSRKRLAQRFRAAIGMDPRAFAGLARFERFAHLLQATPDIGLAEAAIATGHADQAHLTREVRRYAVTTPAELRRRLIANGGGVRD